MENISEKERREEKKGEEEKREVRKRVGRKRREMRSYDPNTINAP
jgi:hypothetical protein